MKYAHKDLTSYFDRLHIPEAIFNAREFQIRSNVVVYRLTVLSIHVFVIMPPQSVVVSWNRDLI